MLHMFALTLIIWANKQRTDSHINKRKYKKNKFRESIIITIVRPQ